MKAVILAGGLGTRLRPYTTIFPKPLMPIGDKPVLEIIIKQLKTYGFTEIIITVGYLAELIYAFFGDGSKFGVKIKYSREDQPMGTAAALGSIKEELSDTFLMMNGDVLSTINYSDLVEYHRRNNSIATIALKKRDVLIDFGVISVDESNCLKGYKEKPVINYLVSMGIYVLEPKVLDYVKPREKLDFPDLILKLMSDQQTVKGYVFDGYWLDIGRSEDYASANEDIEQMYDRLLRYE